jgi:hypothetical protein
MAVRLRLAPIALCLAVAAVSPGDAWAQKGKKPAASTPATGGNLIQTGRNLFEDQRYEESIQTLSAALLKPNTPKNDRIEIYRLLAYNYIALNQKDEAEAAVRGLFVLDPEFSLGSSESPRFKDFFKEVKKKWEADGKPGLVTEEAAPPKPASIKHTSPAQQEQGKEIRLTGELDDPDKRVSSVVLHYRAGSQAKFDKVDARLSERRFRTLIPGDVVKPPLVEYYFEALDGKGLPIASRGDATAPLRIAVPEPPKGSVFSSPWFWTGAGAVVVGAVIVGVVFATRKSENDNPNSRVIVTVGQQ